MTHTNLEKICFLIAGLCILSTFFLAFVPRDTKTRPTTSISHFAVLEDTANKLTIDEVRLLNTRFIPAIKTTLYRKRSPSAFWISFTIDPSNKNKEVRYLEINNANLEEIDIYFPGYPVIHAGKKTSVHSIQIKTRIWNIPIPMDIPENEVTYVRVHTNTIMRVPLAVVPATTVINKTILDTAIFSCFFGILITIFIVNIFSYFILKNKNFLIYALYLLFLFLYQLRVHGFVYFIPMSFTLLEDIGWLSLGATGICMMIFAQYFLDLQKRDPIVNITLNVFICLFIMQTVTGMFVSPFLANQIAYVTGFLMPLIIITSTTKLYLKGFAQAKYYLLAWCALFSGTVIWSLSAVLETQISANYFFIIGTSLDSLLFTLAIFNMIKKELAEKAHIVEREKHYINLSRTDSLTGLYNRRYLDDIVKRLEIEKNLCAQNAIIMIDLDNFKKINDTFGHPAGDIVLINVSSIIQKHVRKTDIACRYGGDEFLIFLPGASALAAQAIAEKICKEIEHNHSCFTDTGDKIKHTISIGISESRESDSFDGNLLRADAALYKAKKLGRNRISVL